MAKYPYFEDKGSWYCIEPYCKIICNSIPEDKYKHVCDTYSYENCNYYKNHR